MLHPTPHRQKGLYVNDLGEAWTASGVCGMTSLDTLNYVFILSLAKLVWNPEKLGDFIEHSEGWLLTHFRNHANLGVEEKNIWKNKLQRGTKKSKLV